MQRQEQKARSSLHIDINNQLSNVNSRHSVVCSAVCGHDLFSHIDWSIDSRDNTTEKYCNDEISLFTPLLTSTQ